MDKFEVLRKEVEELYLKEGLTDRVLILSEKLDNLIIEKQKESLQSTRID